MSGSKPKKEFRAGAVRATIWENERQKDGEQFTTQTVQIERRYKDDQGNWSSTNRFRKTELAAVQMVAAEAYKYLALQERSPENETGQGERPATKQ